MPFLMPPGYMADHTTLMRLCDDSGATVFDFTDPTFGLVINYVDDSFPAVREATMLRSSQDGTTDTTQWIGSRTVVAEVTLPDAGYYPVEDQIRACLHPSSRYYLHILKPGWVEERRTQVRAATYACPPVFPVVAQIGWVAPSGTLEGAPSAVALLPTFSNQEGGVSTPFATPVTLTPGFNPGASSVVVGGTAPTFPVATIYGPCVNPALFLSGSQQTLAFNLSISAGNYLQVDFAARTVYLNNNTALSQYGTLDFPRSSWWQLSPGTQLVAFNPASASGSSQAVLTWRPRYI